MSALRRSRDAVVGDLTRTRHMLMVSAVILGATFVPLIGGPPQAHEWAELREVISGQRATVSVAPPAISVPQQEARVQRTSARIEQVALTEEDAELTTLALTAEAEPEPALLGSDDELAVIEPEETEELNEPAVAELPPIDVEEPIVPNA